MYRDRNDGKQFQSTLPTRGSDYGHIYRHAIAAGISIHAPHEGERPQRACFKGQAAGISIHAPHEGERPVQARHNDRIQ